MYNFKAYIDGKFIKTENTLEIINPLDNSVAGTVSALKEAELDKAFEAANLAFKTYNKTTLESRIKLLEKFNELLLKNKNIISEILLAEVAKPLAEGVIEVERTYDYIKETIDVWQEVKFSQIKLGKKTANIHRLPLGVVLAISPFNYPINLSLSKIAPALLIGNTVVFKPATNGSLTGAFLGQLFDEANYPKGTFNVVTGRGRDIGDLLTSHKHIKMISFTGGVEVGKRIAKNQAMIPLVLELGGNDLGYVRYDADLVLAAKEVAKGAFSYSGQRCTAIKRLLVSKKIKDEFMPLLLAEVTKMRPNPLVTTSAADYVEELINDSKTHGDKFLLEGKRDVNTLPFHVVETRLNSRAWSEEAFGPLLPVVYLEDETKLVDIINDTSFGLQNSLFTSDIKWAKLIALEIESGTVNINRSSSRGPDIFPFSGLKDSGFGVQGIKDALISMSHILNVVEND